MNLLDSLYIYGLRKAPISVGFNENYFKYGRDRQSGIYVPWF